MTTHAGHDTIEAIAALVLSLAGAVVLLLAARDRRAGRGMVARGRSVAGPASGPLRSATAGLAVSFSLAAAVIHLAAAPDHVRELGSLGLGFYLATVFQAGWAVAYLRRPRATVAGLGIAGNLAIVAAWAWTRTVGLPVGLETGHPESIGLPDLLATVLELGLVALLAIGLSRHLRAAIRGLGAPIAGNATIVAVPLVGIVFLATTLAVSIAAGGGHGPGAHDPSAPAMTSHATP